MLSYIEYTVFWRRIKFTKVVVISTESGLTKPGEVDKILTLFRLKSTPMQN